MTPKQISLRDIRIDGGTQSRVELNNTTVEEYSEAMADGVQFPPVVVFFDGASHWLADGFHRYFGADQAGLEEIAADVRNGTQLDAQLFSFGVNSDHGLRRTNADKRKAVTGALNHPVSCKWSNSQIAKHCGVSDKTVAAVRDSHFGNSEVTTAERTYTTKHGTTAVMNTANVGKKKNAKKDKPAQQPKPTVEMKPTAPQGNTANTEVPEYDGPSDEEIRAAELQQQADEAIFNKLLLDDDKLSTAYAEIKRLNAVNAALEARLQGLMNEKAEAIRLCKSLQRKVDKLEKVSA